VSGMIDGGGKKRKEDRTNRKRKGGVGKTKEVGPRQIRGENRTRVNPREKQGAERGNSEVVKARSKE